MGGCHLDGITGGRTHQKVRLGSEVWKRLGGLEQGVQGWGCHRR